MRDAAVLNFPEAIQKAWKLWKAHKLTDPWIMVPTSAGGVVFCFADDVTPLLLPSTEELAKLKDAVGREEKRDENELYKLLIQRMPIDSDGHLVFELDEVAQIHAGVANMLRDLDTVDVLTTFGETTLENLQDSSAATQSNNRIEKYSDNAWDAMGVSKLFFNADNSSSLAYVIKRLESVMQEYINAYSNESFYEFKLIKNDPSIKVEKGNETIKVLFNPINYDPKAHDDLLTNIIYNVKVVPKDTYIKNEKTDLIAITESPVKTKQFKHTGIDMKTARFDGINDDYAYVQVIAALTHGSFIEYVAYQAVDSNGKVIDPSSNPKDDKTPVTPTDDKKPAPPDNKNKALIAIIVVSCFLFVVVVVLVVVIVMYNSKNKDLLTQVNKISFVQSGASAKDDANLLLDNQNELD